MTQLLPVVVGMITIYEALERAKAGADALDCAVMFEFNGLTIVVTRDVDLEAAARAYNATHRDGRSGRNPMYNDGRTVIGFKGGWIRYPADKSLTGGLSYSLQYGECRHCGASDLWLPTHLQPFDVPRCCACGAPWDPIRKDETDD